MVSDAPLLTKPGKSNSRELVGKTRRRGYRSERWAAESVCCPRFACRNCSPLPTGPALNKNKKKVDQAAGAGINLAWRARETDRSAAIGWQWQENSDRTPTVLVLIVQAVFFINV